MNSESPRGLIPRSTTLRLIDTLEALQARNLEASEQWELLDDTGRVPAAPSYAGLLQHAVDAQALSHEVVRLSAGFAHSADSTTHAGTVVLAHLATAATQSSHAAPFFAETAENALSLFPTRPVDRMHWENRMVINHATARRYLRHTSESLGNAAKELRFHLDLHRFFPASAGREIPAPPPPGPSAPHR
ncbi:hypothetical protein ACIQ7D_10190 [Streptomyces sp. NPDC096310]|uniref:hypothetical protein n=1 Tax=Streptomyces sp. NPDC096310 TaxID=3366082 RepID=UPI0037F514DD